MRKDLARFESSVARYIPDWHAAAVAVSIPGSGLSFMGKLAVVLCHDRLVVLTEAKIMTTVYYDAVLRVREVDFKGLVLERDGVLVAPNETSGLEIVYNASGRFERTIRLLTYSANHARQLVEDTSAAVAYFLDEQERRGGLTYNPKTE